MTAIRDIFIIKEGGLAFLVYLVVDFHSVVRGTSGKSLFALLELTTIEGNRRKVTQIKLFKLDSVNCFSFQSQ